MKFYAISGLGADHRVFEFLELHSPITVVKWEIPDKNESIESYAKKLLSQIDTNSDFGLLGVSFGGLVATELSKICTPKNYDSCFFNSNKI